MRRLLRTTAVLVGAIGATVGAAYGMLSQLGRRAHRQIMIPGWFPSRADGLPVPLADVLARELLVQSDGLFSRDHFHPSAAGYNAAGYNAACSVLLPALCSGLVGDSSSTSLKPT